MRLLQQLGPPSRHGIDFEVFERLREGHFWLRSNRSQSPCVRFSRAILAPK